MDSDTTRRRRPASGRFVLRIDPALHASLRDAARAVGTSLNRYCAGKLASPAPVLDHEAAAIVHRARAILGESLLGVVAFGSWTRGDCWPKGSGCRRRWRARPNGWRTCRGRCAGIENWRFTGPRICCRLHAANHAW